MNTFRNAMLCMVLTLSAQLAVAGPNLVINGGFETGFTGWTQSGDTGTQTVSADNPGGTLRPGLVFSDGAWVGDGLGNGYLSQSIATTAGTKYTLQFDLQRWDSGTRDTDPVANFAEVMFAGAVIFAETNVAGDWMHFTFINLTTAGGPSILRLGSNNTFDYNQWDNLSLVADDLAVQPPDGQAPEPASIAMLLLGIGVLGLTRRKHA